SVVFSSLVDTTRLSHSFATRRSSDLWGDHFAVKQQECEQCSVESKDRAAGTRANSRWMPNEARDAATEARNDVQNTIGSTAGQRLHEWADVGEHPHIEGEMDDSKMKK